MHMSPFHISSIAASSEPAGDTTTASSGLAATGASPEM
jgi:hypothetical protein